MSTRPSEIEPPGASGARGLADGRTASDPEPSERPASAPGGSERAADEAARGAPEPPRAPHVERGTVDTALGTVASTADPATGGSVSAFTLSSWAVARHTLAVALVIGAIVLLWKIQEVLLLLLLAIIFATAIEPLVNRLRAGPFSRGQGILIVYTVLFAAIAAVGFFFIPGLVDQGTAFVGTVPERVAATAATDRADRVRTRSKRLAARHR